MNKPCRKILYWGGGLSVYLLTVAVILCLLFEVDLGRLLQPDIETAMSSGQKKREESINALEKLDGAAGILLPLGPGDGQLPGFPEVWEELFRARDVKSGPEEHDGFDGLQAADNAAALINGFVAERFISGAVSKVFRRGNFLLALNAQGNVQVFDCENPRAPKGPTYLPYQQVKNMEMMGDIAYLQIKRSAAHHDTLVVADLRNPLKPRELKSLSLPEQTMSFFLLGPQLIVHTNSRGFQADYAVHLYDVTDDYRFIPLGHAESPRLGKGFLKYGDYLLLADLRAGLKVCDFSNPLKPKIVAELALPDKVKQLARHGDLVIALGERQRLYVIDLHNPLSPELLTVAENAKHTAAFLEMGESLYVFNENGYLRIFDMALPNTLNHVAHPFAGLAGVLTSMHAGDGFTLLGSLQEALPEAVTDVREWSGTSPVIDELAWQGGLVVLDGDGLLQFFRKGKGTSLELQGHLQLPASQRWVAAFKDRLYVGGESHVTVIAKDQEGRLFSSGQLDLSADESWDGLVVQETLWVAAGRTGVLSFSVEQPDRLTPTPGWEIPFHLESRVDARQLASTGAGRVLVAAGSAGLLGMSKDRSGRFQLDGVISFPVPIYTLAVLGEFCLVSTGNEIFVIDVKSQASLQNLGGITLPGVTKIAVASPNSWAGYVPGDGWLVLPAPRRVAPDQVASLRSTGSAVLTEQAADRYRLVLYNDEQVVTVPGVLTRPRSPVVGTEGAAHGSL